MSKKMEKTLTKMELKRKKSEFKVDFEYDENRKSSMVDNEKSNPKMEQRKLSSNKFILAAKKSFRGNEKISEDQKKDFSKSSIVVKKKSIKDISRIKSLSKIDSSSTLSTNNVENNQKSSHEENEEINVENVDQSIPTIDQLERNENLIDFEEDKKNEEISRDEEDLAKENEELRDIMIDLGIEEKRKTMERLRNSKSNETNPKNKFFLHSVLTNQKVV